MAIEVFNRVEKKYLIDESTYQTFRELIEPYMETDAFCSDDKFYSINNIYYDTDSNELIRNSIEKPVYKEKLRLRSYGIPTPDDMVFLEIKKKFNGVVNKRRTVIGLSRAYDLLDNGIVPDERDYLNMQVVRELKYFIGFYNPVPKLFLKYDRKALFGKEDRDLRITFDKNIRTRRDNLRLETGDDGELLLEEGTLLMEIKTTTSFPLWLTSILTKYEIKGVSFSKYGTEYKKFIQGAR